LFLRSFFKNVRFGTDQLSNRNFMLPSNRKRRRGNRWFDV
jgi:hypothetical protein